MQKVKLYNKKGKTKKQAFEVGELVAVQNLKTRDWKTRGNIVSVRTATDGHILSYDLNIDDLITSRHRVYLRKLEDEASQPAFQ